MLRERPCAIQGRREGKQDGRGGRRQGGPSLSWEGAWQGHPRGHGGLGAATRGPLRAVPEAGDRPSGGLQLCPQARLLTLGPRAGPLGPALSVCLWLPAGVTLQTHPPPLPRSPATASGTSQSTPPSVPATPQATENRLPSPTRVPALPAPCRPPPLGLRWLVLSSHCLLRGRGSPSECRSHCVIPRRRPGPSDEAKVPGPGRPSSSYLGSEAWLPSAPRPAPPSPEPAPCSAPTPSPRGPLGPQTKAWQRLAQGPRLPCGARPWGAATLALASLPSGPAPSWLRSTPPPSRHCLVSSPRTDGPSSRGQCQPLGHSGTWLPTLPTGPLLCHGLLSCPPARPRFHLSLCQEGHCHSPGSATRLTGTSTHLPQPLGAALSHPHLQLKPSEADEMREQAGLWAQRPELGTGLCARPGPPGSPHSVTLIATISRRKAH